ncbi:PTS system mannose/fructose/sorbose family transporter subunit IID [Salmonella enterica subsp. enterica]|nr:PTS system mannose/fructose/sorbose family transporter subunit IID [Salmonella enterica subsp. enterica]
MTRDPDRAQALTRKAKAASPPRFTQRVLALLCVCKARGTMNASSIWAMPFAMSPALKRIYGTPPNWGVPCESAIWCCFNTYAASVNVCLWPVDCCDGGGENQRNPDFNEESINAVKGQPDGAAGRDRRFHLLGTSLKVIAAGMGIYFAQQGSILGPILALLVYNIPHILCRWYALKLGYRAGTTTDAPLAKAG